MYFGLLFLIVVSYTAFHVTFVSLDNSTNFASFVKQLSLFGRISSKFTK